MHFLAFIFLCKSFIPPSDGDGIKAQGAEFYVDKHFSDWQVKLVCDHCYGCSALVLPLVIGSGPHSRAWSLLFRPGLHGVLNECCGCSERVLPLGRAKTQRSLHPAWPPVPSFSFQCYSSCRVLHCVWAALLSTRYPGVLHEDFWGLSSKWLHSLQNPDLQL